MHVSSICLVSCTLISVTEPLLTHSRCHRQPGRRSADLSIVRLIIQVHIAVVHEFAGPSDRLKGTKDSLQDTECHQPRMPTTTLPTVCNAPPKYFSLRRCIRLHSRATILNNALRLDPARCECRMNKQLRQVGGAHQIPIALTRRTTALIDCPDHKTLPPPTIPRREHTFDVRREPSMLGHNVRPRITLNPEILEQRLLRPGEPHRKQH